jgi:Ca2+-binding RTX toxin-like protein
VSWTLAVQVEDLELIGPATSGTGNTLANLITGNAGANSLSGLDAADTLNGAGGADTMDGGAGNDLLLVGEAGDVAIGGDGADTVSASIGVTLGADVEALLLTGAGNIGGTGNALANRLIGNAGDNSLSGGDAADTLEGGGGNDTLDGGSGADSLSGGAGNDLFLFDDAGDVLTDSAGADTLRASVSVTLAAGIEVLELLDGALNGTGNSLNNLLIGNTAGNLLNGGSGNDTLEGRGGADTLIGALGNDSLLGGEGADSLNGNGGADTMVGGAGDDSYVLDEAGDVVTEGVGGGTDTVFVGFTYGLGGTVENLVLTGGEAATGTGNGLANTLTGNNAANLLSGGAGNDSLLGLNGADTLNGGAGADTLAGGIGSDRYIVDSALDVIIELEGEGSDQVVTAISFTLADGIENLQLTGAAAVNGFGSAAINRLAGNDGANLLRGFGGNDNLLGGGGADTLDGGVGRDALTGNAGADWFLLADPSATDPDRIVDFTPGEDLIALAGPFFVGLPAGPVAAASFVAHAALTATSAAGVPQFIYHTGLGVLSFDADGAGGAVAVRLASLVGAPALTAGDLLLI